MPPSAVGKLAISIAMALLVSGCTESTWIPELPLEACAELAEQGSSADPSPMACSCGTVTSTETWTVGSSGGQCTLTAPANPICTKTTITGGFRLTCEYDYGAPDCTQLQFTRPVFNPNLLGLVVSDPVCYSSPASPHTGGSVTTKIQIPDPGARELRVDWAAWDTLTQDNGCTIQILTSQENQTEAESTEAPR